MLAPVSLLCAAQRTRTLRFPELLSILDVAQEGDVIHCVTEPVVPLLSLTDAAAPGPDEAVLGLHAITVCLDPGPAWP